MAPNPSYIRSRGFIALPLTAWLAIGASVAFLGMGVALRVQSERLASCKQEFAAFQAEVKALGEAAAAEAKRIEAENKAKKDKYDKQINSLRAANAVLNRRLRDSAGQSSLPAPAPGSASPDRACFDRGILDDAIRAFTAGTAAIATEGQSAVDALNNAREWAAGR